MTIFEEYMDKSIKYTETCKKCMNKDANLSMFYKNASIGFKEKAFNLSLEDAGKTTV